MPHHFCLFCQDSCDPLAIQGYTFADLYIFKTRNAENALHNIGCADVGDEISATRFNSVTNIRGLPFKSVHRYYDVTKVPKTA